MQTTTKKDKDQFIEQTIAVWQPMTPRKLTAEDAREIIDNVGEFYQILREWHAADRAKQQSTPNRK